MNRVNFLYQLFFVLTLTSFLVSEEILTTKSLKLVSTSSAITEILFKLDAGNQIIARDDSSKFPHQQISFIPVIKNGHGLDIHRIKAFKPTHLFIYENLVYAELVEYLSPDIQIIKVPYPTSLDDTFNMIESISIYLNEREKAYNMMKNIYLKVIKSRNIAKKFKFIPSITFLHAMNKNSIYTSGDGTLANAFINEAGATNSFDKFNGYRNIDNLNIDQIDSDLILVTSKTLSHLGGLNKIYQHQKLKHLKSVKRESLMVLDESCLNFGPRIGDFIYQLTMQLYHFQSI